MENIQTNFMFWFSEAVVVMGIFFWTLATFFPSTMDILLVFSPNEIESVSDNQFFRLAWGIGGAIMVGWAISLHALNQSGIEGRLSTTNLLYVAFGSWFILDSTASIVTGFYYNVIGNVFFLLLGILSINSFSGIDTEDNVSGSAN